MAQRNKSETLSLPEFSLISMLDEKLKAFIQLHQSQTVEIGNFWLMVIHLFYENAPAGVVRFNLQGYDREEAMAVARNLKQNRSIMKEIDEALWADGE